MLWDTPPDRLLHREDSLEGHEPSTRKKGPPMPRTLPLSLIDFSTVYPGQSGHDAIATSVTLAQRAEGHGFRRVWYAEHHNAADRASSVPAVLIAHIGAKTNTIRLGAGGVMLPNHAPYSIAEQFGTLAEMYPGRIDLGLGRAPGTDAKTVGRALRRPYDASDNFPQDVVELDHYLKGSSQIPGVQAYPGAGTNVPVYILGSSMYGATLAAALGLPYAFASHFASQHLADAVAYYREHFTPSVEWAEPYVLAGVNVIAAETETAAQEKYDEVLAKRMRRHGPRARTTLRFAGVGTGEQAAGYLEEFAEKARADELLINFEGATPEQARDSLDSFAPAWEL